MWIQTKWQFFFVSQLMESHQCVRMRIRKHNTKTEHPKFKHQNLDV